MEQAVPWEIDFVTGFEEGTNVVVVRRKHDFHIFFPSLSLSVFAVCRWKILVELRDISGDRGDA